MSKISKLFSFSGKKKANKSQVPVDNQDNGANKVLAVHNPKDTILSVLPEYRDSSTLEILQQHPELAVQYDGQTYYLSFMVNADDPVIGGINKKRRLNESIGSMVEEIKNDEIQAYIPPALGEQNKFIILPTEKSIQNMGDFVGTLANPNLKYEIVLLGQKGDDTDKIDIVTTAVPMIYDDIADFINDDDTTVEDLLRDKNIITDDSQKPNNQNTGFNPEAIVDATQNKLKQQDATNNNPNIDPQDLDDDAEMSDEDKAALAVTGGNADSMGQNPNHLSAAEMSGPTQTTQATTADDANTNALLTGIPDTPAPTQPQLTQGTQATMPPQATAPVPATMPVQEPQVPVQNTQAAQAPSDLPFGGNDFADDNDDDDDSTPQMSNNDDLSNVNFANTPVQNTAATNPAIMPVEADGTEEYGFGDDAIDEDSITSDDLNKAITRIFYDENLDLDVSSAPIDAMLDRNYKWVPFDIHRENDGLGKYLNQISRQANHDMASMHARHKDQARQMFMAYITKGVDGLKANLDDSTTETEFGSRKSEITRSANDKLTRVEELAKPKQQKIQDEFDKRVEDEGERAAKQARADYIDRMGGQLADKKEAVVGDLRQEIETERLDLMSNLADDERKYAKSSYDQIVTQGIQYVIKKYKNMLKSENKTRDAWAKRLEKFVTNHRKDEAERTRVLKREVESNKKAHEIQESMQAKLDEQVRESKVKEDALRQQIDTLNKSHEATLSHIKAENKSTIDRIKADADAKVSQANSQVADLKSQLDSKDVEHADTIKQLKHKLSLAEAKADANKREVLAEAKADNQAEVADLKEQLASEKNSRLQDKQRYQEQIMQAKQAANEQLDHQKDHFRQQRNADSENYNMKLETERNKSKNLQEQLAQAQSLINTLKTTSQGHTLDELIKVSKKQDGDDNSLAKAIEQYKLISELQNGQKQSKKQTSPITWVAGTVAVLALGFGGFQYVQNQQITQTNAIRQEMQTQIKKAKQEQKSSDNKRINKILDDYTRKNKILDDYTRKNNAKKEEQKKATTNTQNAETTNSQGYGYGY